MAQQIAAALQEAVDLYPTGSTRDGYDRYCHAAVHDQIPTVEDTVHAVQFAQRAEKVCALMTKAQTLAAEARQTEEKTHMTYVNRLETNVKSKRGGAYDLTPCTLITGPNGSGKSAIIDALSLALTGESRTEGLKKRPDMLLRLAPPGPGGVGASELYARAKLSDGTEPGFRLTGKEIDWQPGDIAIGPRGVFLVDVARALLYGDAKALVQSIARSTRAVIFRDALENEVTKSIFPLFNEIWTEDCRLDGKLERTVGEVQTCLDATERRLKEAKNIMKVAKAGTVLAVPLSDDEEAELCQAMLVLSAARSGQTLEALRDELADLPPYNPEEFTRVRDRAQLFAAVKAALMLLDKHVPANVAFTCPICARPGAQKTRLRKRLELVLDFERRTEEELARGYMTGKQHDLFAATTAFINRGMATGDLQARRATLLGRKEAAASEPTRMAVKAVTQEEVDKLELIRAVCRDAVKNATDQQLGTVERRINRALPTSYRAKIISEGGYRVELMKDELQRDFRALSGAERAMLLSAFASATIPEGAPPVRLIVVDETWLDARSLKTLMKALVKVVGSEGGPTQAIICAVKATGKAVDGWSEIKLGGAQDEETDNV